LRKVPEDLGTMAVLLIGGALIDLVLVAVLVIADRKAAPGPVHHAESDAASAGVVPSDVLARSNGAGEAGADIPFAQA
jgi:hypothetical protein